MTGAGGRRPPPRRRARVAAGDDRRDRRARRRRPGHRRRSPGRSTRCASAPRPDLDRPALPAVVLGPMSARVARSVPLVVVLVGHVAAAAGRVDGGQRGRRRRRSRSARRAVPGERRRRCRHRLHPWAFVKFVVFVLYSLVMSSWAVIKVDRAADADGAARRASCASASSRVAADHHDRGQRDHAHAGDDDAHGAARAGRAHVHVLGLDDPDEFRASVLDLERRTVAAFTPRCDDRRGTAASAGIVRRDRA